MRKFFKRSFADMKLNDDLRQALNFGTTLPTRFWLGLASLIQALGFYSGNPSWFISPVYTSMNQFWPLSYWANSFFIVGVLAMWRVFDTRPFPIASWIINILHCLLWASAVSVRLKMGMNSLASVHTIFVLMSVQVLLRTEATQRDTRTS